MTDVIQRNAANILAISLLFFTRTNSSRIIQLGAPAPSPNKEKSSPAQNHFDTATMLLPA